MNPQLKLHNPNLYLCVYRYHIPSLKMGVSCLKFYLAYRWSQQTEVNSYKRSGVLTPSKRTITSLRNNSPVQPKKVTLNQESKVTPSLYIFLFTQMIEWSWIFLVMELEILYQVIYGSVNGLVQIKQYYFSFCENIYVCHCYFPDDPWCEKFSKGL